MWPRGVAVDSSNHHVFVAEDSRIQEFTEVGTPVTQWGKNGTGNGEFDGPHAVGVDSSTHMVFVGDDGENHRIQVFAPH